MKKLFFIFLYLLVKPCFSNSTEAFCFYIDNSKNVICVDLSESDIQERPNPVFKLFKNKQRLNKRITAAVLAFPFPFGMVGLHRIYLGTKPYVPVAYIASLGGVFGILPFIDFCAIAFDKDFDYYRDNGKVLMWVRE